MTPTRLRLLVPLLALAALLSGCSGSTEAAANPTPEPAQPTPVAASPTPTPTPSPTPTPTATPSPTPTPEPTPDPLIVEAETVAETYFVETAKTIDDARNVDLTQTIALEHPDGPMKDYGLRLVAGLLNNNHRLPIDGVTHTLAGVSVVDRDAGHLEVYICVQTGGEWFDFDTGETTLRSRTEPFLSTYEVRTGTEGGDLKIWTVAESDEDGHPILCELGEQHS